MSFGAVIHRFSAVTSTNDTARELARAGAEHGTAVTADEQTRGRGTKGRTWHSPAGLGLYVSFVLRPGDGPETRASAGVDLKLKWPNDLVRGRRKAGGILTEAVFQGEAPSFAVVGIGINVNQTEEDFPPEIGALATSLRLVTGREQSREGLLGELCRALESWYNALIRGPREAVVRAAEGRMAFAPGGRVRLSTGTAWLAGAYLGLDPEGRLRVDAPGGAVTVAFEEVRALDWD
jgi:BirA family biotin operon repressor/biotin-[acetyl-CoA-carboxylase] ligase